MQFRRILAAAVVCCAAVATFAAPAQAEVYRYGSKTYYSDFGATVLVQAYAVRVGNTVTVHCDAESNSVHLTLSCGQEGLAPVTAGNAGGYTQVSFLQNAANRRICWSAQGIYPGTSRRFGGADCTNQVT